MPLANVQAPRGFLPYKFGGKWVPKRTTRSVTLESGNLAPGDVYTVDTAGAAARAAAGGIVRGVCEGIVLNPIPASAQGPVSQDYIASGDGGSIIGIEDADAEFIVQTGAGFDATTDIGKLCSHVDAAPNAALAQSRQYLDAAGAAGTNFKLLAMVDSPADNATGDYAWVVVRLLLTDQTP